MTREQAITIAREAAFRCWGDHSYLSGKPPLFEPHEWVIDAILTANSQGYAQCLADEQNPP